MKKLFGSLVALALLVSPLGLSGCTPKEEKKVPEKKAEAGHNHAHEHGHGHDHGDHAENYADAVAQLTKLNSEIKAAFEKDDSEAAHGPLHGVVDVLDALYSLAKKEEMSEEQLAAVKKSRDILLDNFEKVDAVFHGDGDTKYADVAKEIEAALATLNGAVKKEESSEEKTTEEKSSEEKAPETSEKKE